MNLDFLNSYVNEFVKFNKKIIEQINKQFTLNAIFINSFKFKLGASFLDEINEVFKSLIKCISNNLGTYKKALNFIFHVAYKSDSDKLILESSIF